jgi:hypothetical protein|tara:strand:+ start:466 stop:684 length:219 start_codon:yes stop_codon:yes gene_type:complete
MKSNKVSTLIKEKQKIEDKIEDIQKKCPHFNKSIKLVRERLDSTTVVIRYKCNTCLLLIGYPNEKEIQKFIK